MLPPRVGANAPPVSPCSPRVRGRPRTQRHFSPTCFARRRKLRRCACSGCQSAASPARAWGRQARAIVRYGFSSAPPPTSQLSPLLFATTLSATPPSLATTSQRDPAQPRHHFSATPPSLATTSQVAPAQPRNHLSGRPRPTSQPPRPATVPPSPTGAASLIGERASDSWAERRADKHCPARAWGRPARAIVRYGFSSAPPNLSAQPAPIRDDSQRDPAQPRHHLSARPRPASPRPLSDPAQLATTLSATPPSLAITSQRDPAQPRHDLSARPRPASPRPLSSTASSLAITSQRDPAQPRHDLSARPRPASQPPLRSPPPSPATTSKLAPAQPRNHLSGRPRPASQPPRSAHVPHATTGAASLVGERASGTLGPSAEREIER